VKIHAFIYGTYEVIFTQMLTLVPTLLRRSKPKRCGSFGASIPKGIRNAFALPGFLQEVYCSLLTIPELGVKFSFSSGWMRLSSGSQ